MTVAPVSARGAAAIELDALTPEDVDAILAWRYPGHLAVYDLDESARGEMLASDGGYLAVRIGGELAGHVCTGAGARVPGLAPRADVVDVGMGFRPDRIGRGEARVTIPAILGALERQLGGGPISFRAVVAGWNGRARAAVAHSGFAESGRFVNARGEWIVFVRPAASSDPAAPVRTPGRDRPSALPDATARGPSPPATAGSRDAAAARPASASSSSRTRPLTA